jgi:hypothetical protein
MLEGWWKRRPQIEVLDYAMSRTYRRDTRSQNMTCKTAWKGR